MKNCARKIRDENVILIHPTLRHLLDKEVYVLHHNSETWYVPLWEPESEIDSSDGIIHIRCIPSIDDIYWIGDENRLHVEIEADITDAFAKQLIKVKIEEKEYFIPSDELKITKKQTYTARNCGIPKPNMDHAKNECLSDIVFHITLS